MHGTMDLVLVVAFSSWLAPALGSAFGREVFVSAADDEKDFDSAFQYDYESVRIAGLIFAVGLCLLGIFIVIGRKCTCSKSDKSRGPEFESAIQRAEDSKKCLPAGATRGQQTPRGQQRTIFPGGQH
ncbi:FXYD domain-containing ion transport regulator 6-like isoform 2-T2 [Anableps anableps]